MDCKRRLFQTDYSNTSGGRTYTSRYTPSVKALIDYIETVGIAENEVVYFERGQRDPVTYTWATAHVENAGTRVVLTVMDSCVSACQNIRRLFDVKKEYTEWDSLFMGLGTVFLISTVDIPMRPTMVTAKGIVKPLTGKGHTEMMKRRAQAHAKAVNRVPRGTVIR